MGGSPKMQDGVAGHNDEADRRSHRGSGAGLLLATSTSADVDVDVEDDKKGIDRVELEERGPSSGSRGTTNSAEVTAGAGIRGEDGDDAATVEEGNSAVTYRVYKRRWFGLVMIILLNLIVSWDWLSFAPVASQAAEYYGVSETAINWLSTSFMFAFVVVAPLVIRVLHWGPKPSLATAAALILVGNWIRYAGSHSKAAGSGAFSAVVVGQILTGFAQPFVLAAPTRYSDLWFTARGRVTATAIASLANPFGAALGQLINPAWVNDAEDISSMVLYVSIISSVASIPAFFVPAKPPTPAAASNNTPKLPILRSLRTTASSRELWLILIPFAVFVGFFNSISSLLNQIMEPYGFSDTDAGIGGALLIVVGLVSSAITSPLLDRSKRFLEAIKICVPIIGLCYLIFIWMPAHGGGVAGPYVVLSILGASSFSLVPVALELLCELSHPVSPEITSTIAWGGGQLLGGIFIVISDALEAGPDGDPPNNMTRSLIFQAVIALATVPLPLALGLFGRSEHVRLRRLHSDQSGARPAGVV